MGKHKTQAEREIALRVGARIRQLREIQHVSQIRLATEIGIRAGPLGWIEKGKHLPSGRVLYRIARQLNVRLDDLFQEADVWQAAASPADAAPTLLPPLDMDASSEPVKAAHIVCQSVVDKLVALEGLCGAAQSAALALAVPVAPTESGAEHVAARIRQGLGIGAALLPDYVEVLEAAGLRIVFLDMPDGADTFSGCDRHNRNAFIFVNSRLKKQPELQLFRLLFELGRICWAAGRQADVAAAEETQLDEAAFARRFAECFLMPAEAVRAAAWQLGVAPKDWTAELVLRQKRRCGVTARSFAQRLASLGLCACDKQKRGSARHFPLVDDVEALYAGDAAAEPGGSRAPLAANGRLGDLLLCAERSAKDPKALAAIKRVLRQSGLKLDA